MPQASADYSLIIVWTTLIFLFLVAGIIVFILLYQNKHREYLIQKNSFQENLLQAQIEIKEQTLRHVARELHDTLGQTASLIKIYLNTISPNKISKSNQKIKETTDLVKQLILDIKSISWGLVNHSVTQLGLVKSLEQEVERINKLEQMKAVLQAPETVPLSHDTLILLFRMVQEVLNNTLKHSKASSLTLTLAIKKNILTLVITDNGVGFDVRTLAGSGMGLANLQSRAKQIQATCVIQSIPHTGTSISIELPLENEASRAV